MFLLAKTGQSGYKSVSELPSLSLYEGEDRPYNPGQLFAYNPSFGHEYGFSNFGTRRDDQDAENLSIKDWDIEEVAKLVDAITWANR